MGSAYQCDRCGKLYTAKYNTCIDLMKHNGEYRSVKFDCGLYPDIDLCQDCQKEFLHWWGNETVISIEKKTTKRGKNNG